MTTEEKLQLLENKIAVLERTINNFPETYETKLTCRRLNVMHESDIERNRHNIESLFTYLSDNLFLSRIVPLSLDIQVTNAENGYKKILCKAYKNDSPINSRLCYSFYVSSSVDYLTPTPMLNASVSKGSISFINNDKQLAMTDVSGELEFTFKNNASTVNLVFIIAVDNVQLSDNITFE